MNYSFLDFLVLLGSLGFFLFGMKLMSEALQKVAGDKMRSILASMTSNRFKGVLTGVLITAVIQSSSATTVMVVSFVNAGLLSLVESIGVIMGANVGTTVTAWLISIVGFKIHMSEIALPIIGLSFVLIFSKNNIRKSWGEFLIGFAILFLGLDYLQNSMPPMDSGVLEFLKYYTDMGFFSVIIFVMIGALLTLVIQSSSATMALTLVMCNQGLIPFYMAAAMVLGQNIGTTITANLAALVANVSAKRAAMAHLLFNVFGVILTLIFFYPFLHMIDNLVVVNGGFSAFDPAHPEAIPVTLSIFHSLFNIINTLILIWFVKYIAQISTKLIRQKKHQDEEYRLKYINTGMLSTSELSILQARKEIAVVSKRASKMFVLLPDMLNENFKEKTFTEILNKLAKYEDIIDRMEIEIANYLTMISRGEMSDRGAISVKSMYRIIDEVESISDVCYNIGLNLDRKRVEKMVFTPKMIENVLRMFRLVDLALVEMNKNLDIEYTEATLNKAAEIEGMINKYRDELKLEHLENIKDNLYTYEAGIIYSTVFSLCEKMGDHIINVNEAIVDCKVNVNN